MLINILVQLLEYAGNNNIPVSGNAPFPRYTGYL